MPRSPCSYCSVQSTVHVSGPRVVSQLSFDTKYRSPLLLPLLYGTVHRTVQHSFILSRYATVASSRRRSSGCHVGERGKVGFHCCSKFHLLTGKHSAILPYCIQQTLTAFGETCVMNKHLLLYRAVLPGTPHCSHVLRSNTQNSGKCPRGGARAGRVRSLLVVIKCSCDPYATAGCSCLRNPVLEMRQEKVVHASTGRLRGTLHLGSRDCMMSDLSIYDRPTMACDLRTFTTTGIHVNRTVTHIPESSRFSRG